MQEDEIFFKKMLLIEDRKGDHVMNMYKHRITMTAKFIKCIACGCESINLESMMSRLTRRIAPVLNEPNDNISIPCKIRVSVKQYSNRSIINKKMMKIQSSQDPFKSLQHHMV